MVSHKQHFAIIPGGKKMNCMHNQSQYPPPQIAKHPSLAQHEHHIQNINMDKKK
jgi:hypothetical protein